MCGLAVLLFGSCCAFEETNMSQLTCSLGCTRTKTKFLSIRLISFLFCCLLFGFSFSDMSFNVLIHLEEETFHNVTSVTTL